MRSQRQARVLVGLGPFFMVSSLILLLTGSGLYAADGRAEAQAHADSGLQLARSGDLPSAEAELRQAVKLEPHNPEFLSTLGTLLAIDHKTGRIHHGIPKSLATCAAGLDGAAIPCRESLAIASLSKTPRVDFFFQPRSVLLEAFPIKASDQPELILGRGPHRYTPSTLRMIRSAHWTALAINDSVLGLGRDSCRSSGFFRCRATKIAAAMVLFLISSFHFFLP